MRWIPVACLALVACAEDPFAPTEGVWTRVDGDLLEDSCGLQEGSDTDDSDERTLTLIDHGEGLLTVVSEDDVTWTCHLIEMDFACDPQVMTENEAPGRDAVMTGTGTPTGSFASATEMSGQTAVEVVCAGEDCGLVEDQTGYAFPCTMVQAWTATIDAPE